MQMYVRTKNCGICMYVLVELVSVHVCTVKTHEDIRNVLYSFIFESWYLYTSYNTICMLSILCEIYVNVCCIN